MKKKKKKDKSKIKKKTRSDGPFRVVSKYSIELAKHDDSHSLSSVSLC